MPEPLSLPQLIDALLCSVRDGRSTISEAESEVKKWMLGREQEQQCLVALHALLKPAVSVPMGTSLLMGVNDISPIGSPSTRRPGAMLDVNRRNRALHALRNLTSTPLFGPGFGAPERSLSDPPTSPDPKHASDGELRRRLLRKRLDAGLADGLARTVTPDDVFARIHNTPHQRGLVATIEDIDAMVSIAGDVHDSREHPIHRFIPAEDISIHRMAGHRVETHVRLAGRVLVGGLWTLTVPTEFGKSVLFEVETSKDEQRAQEMRWYVNRKLAIAFNVAAFAQLQWKWDLMNDGERDLRLSQVFRVHRDQQSLCFTPDMRRDRPAEEPDTRAICPIVANVGYDATAHPTVWGPIDLTVPRDAADVAASLIGLQEFEVFISRR